MPTSGAAILQHASLNRADLSGAILDGADLTGASLYLCDLSRARLIETIVTNCTLDSVNVYGISAWGLIGEPASQKNLRISFPGEAWLSALIQGRFSEPRKEVLNALADRHRGKIVFADRNGKCPPSRYAPHRP